MGVIPDKTEYKNCERAVFDRFIGELGREGLLKVTHHAATEASHFERYGYVHDGKKVTVVYDIKARRLSVTSFEETTPVIERVYGRVNTKPMAGAPPEPKPADTHTELSADQTIAEPAKPAGPAAARRGRNKRDKAKPKAAEPAKPPVPKQENAPKAPPAKTPPRQESAPKSPPVRPNAPAPQAARQEPGGADNAGGLSFKKFGTERFAALQKRIRKNKLGKLAEESVHDAGQATELRTYTLAGADGQKVKMQFMPKKEIIQLQGKHGQLYSELQIILSENAGYKTAVDAVGMQQPKPIKTADVERQLKKLIPSAIPYLSEQSRIDFTIGIIEILNGNEEHYDYSMFLLPPFRGLERLIMDLQRAQGIVVKMIGQAYEKQEGNYVLKASYRRKINSVVYAEVMAALYREYFATRNYYTHSDNADFTGTRILSQRAQAKEIFERMLSLVDYNCKKLAEIRFSIQA